MPYANPKDRAAEYAPGIPDKDKKHPIRKADHEDWEFAVHEHHAEKAGKHYDPRVGDPETGHGHSWALPKGMPAPGEQRLAIQQPTHTVDYFDFKGEIPEGYGKGKVNLVSRDKVTVARADPDTVKFKVHHSSNHTEKFALKRTEGDKWLITNYTPTRKRRPDLATDKPAYKEQTTPVYGEQYEFQPKYEGGHALVDFDKKDGQVNFFSYIPSKRSPTGLIDHTYKLDAYHQYRTPSHLVGTVARGEIIAVDKHGKAIQDPEVLGGLLNASTHKSRAKAKELGYRLVPVVYDLDRYKGKDVRNLPYGEKKKLLEEVSEIVPIAPGTRDPKAQKALYEKVTAGHYPLTSEGVVAWPLAGGAPIKIKKRLDHDVYVREIFREKGRDTAGGFTFSHTPDGPVVGRVGTGFSHALKREMWENKDDFIGRVAKVQSRKQFKSNALFQPSFTGWHIEKGKEVLSQAFITGFLKTAGIKDIVHEIKGVFHGAPPRTPRTFRPPEPALIEPRPLTAEPPRMTSRMTPRRPTPEEEKAIEEMMRKNPIPTPEEEKALKEMVSKNPLLKLWF